MPGACWTLLRLCVAVDLSDGADSAADTDGVPTQERHLPTSVLHESFSIRPTVGGPNEPVF